MKKPQTLSLGISPCPNDTFIFSALIKGVVSNENVEFDVDFSDVQTLNEKAIKGEGDILKISFGVWPKIRDNYLLLNCGGAMGYGCGPLLLTLNNLEFDPLKEIWVPGENTTARFLLENWFKEKYPNLTPIFKFALFDEVYQKINSGDVEQAVVIHECRFTYEKDGLNLAQDLGEWWESSKKLPIPLGGIILHRKWRDYKETLESMIRTSIKKCEDNPSFFMEYISEKAQISDEKVMLSHIKTYVNDFSIEMGGVGLMAISEMSGVKMEDILK